MVGVLISIWSVCRWLIVAGLRSVAGWWAVVLYYASLVGAYAKSKLGILGDGEKICGWLFMMELLPLGYHWMRT